MKCRASFLISLLLPTVLITGCLMEKNDATVAPAEEPAAATPTEGLAGKKEQKNIEREVAASENVGDVPEAQATAAASATPQLLPAKPARKMAGLRSKGDNAYGGHGYGSGGDGKLNGRWAGPGSRPATATSAPLQDAQNDVDTLTGEPALRQGRGPKNMYFQHYGTNPTIDTEEEARSTFAVDVDTASYTMTRSFLDRGQLPNEAAVRVEEVVNAFDYGYEAPGRDTFSVHAEAAPSPNRKGYHVLHVGVKGKEIAKSERKSATLVFVIDISGSMDSDNRLGLVKKSLRLLVNQLEEGDKVGIVTYGSEAREVLQPTSAFNKQRILQVINGLSTEGATNAEAGLRKGYAMAARHMKKDRISRVILCSDGVANVGMTGPNSLLETIKSKAKEGITISTVGFGMGNYNDVLMEKLANGGNGNYHYVDKLDEARRVFVEQLTGTLQVIAKDTKIQMHFDPKVVSRYRLIGYENRALKARDFNDDRVDAGEIGAGHAVTAIYEIKLREGASGNLGKVRIRHKQPQGSASRLIERDLPQSIIKRSADALTSPTQLSLVAAQFAEKLRGSYWARNVSYDDILRRFDRIGSPLRSHAKVVELRKLVLKAKQLDKREDKFDRHGPVALMSFDRVPVLR